MFFFCEYVCSPCAGTSGCQKSVLDPLELENRQLWLLGTHPLLPDEQPVLLTTEISLQTQDCVFYSSLSTIWVHKNVWNTDRKYLVSITNDGLHDWGCICLTSVRPWVQYLLITKTLCLLCQTSTAVEKDQEQIRGTGSWTKVGWASGWASAIFEKFIISKAMRFLLCICQSAILNYQQELILGEKKCPSLFWPMHATPALRKLNQDCWEFEASTGYVVSVAWKTNKNKIDKLIFSNILVS